jgi:L-histidine N-alpha-methyltransferase
MRADECAHEVAGRRRHELAQRAQLLDASFGEEGDPIAEEARFGDVVRDEDGRRGAGGQQAADLALELAPHDRIERPERLIEEHEARRQEERARQAHALPLTPRQLAGKTVQEVQGQPPELAQLRGARRHLAGRPPGESRGELHVRAHRQVREETALLDDVSHGPTELGDAAGLDHPTVDRDRSPGWGAEPREHTQERRLATARRTEHRETVAGRDAQIDPAKDVATSENDVQRRDVDLDADRGVHVSSSRFDARTLAEARRDRVTRYLPPWRHIFAMRADPSNFAWHVVRNLQSSASTVAAATTEGTVDEGCHLETSCEKGSGRAVRRLQPRSGEATSHAAFERHVIDGLAASSRALSSLWFYDDHGSHLFREIMALPSYYPTAAEREILERHAPEMVRRCCTERLLVVDLGAGDASKTRPLLEAARDGGVDATYAPIDVSAGALESAEASLAAIMPGQRVMPVVGDYASGLAELMEREPETPRLVLLLGSNVGNLEHDQADELLASIAGGLGPNDRFLVGYDLMKDPQRLRAAYDDPEGVTAAFNLNLLTRINRELGGDFDLRHFRHVATLDPKRPAMESWIVSTRAQTVSVAGRSFQLDAWEAIHTEISCKYGEAHFSRFARAAGLVEEARFYDERRDFVDVLYRATAHRTCAVDPACAGRA